MGRTGRGLQDVLKNADYPPPGKDSVGMEAGMGTCDGEYEPEQDPFSSPTSALDTGGEGGD